MRDFSYKMQQMRETKEGSLDDQKKNAPKKNANVISPRGNFIVFLAHMIKVTKMDNVSRKIQFCNLQDCHFFVICFSLCHASDMLSFVYHFLSLFIMFS